MALTASRATMAAGRPLPDPEALVKAAVSRDLDERRGAIGSLGRLDPAGRRRFVDGLAGLIGSTDEGTRRYAMEGLRGIGPRARAAAPALVRGLAQALEDGETRVSGAYESAIAAVLPDQRDGLSILFGLMKAAVAAGDRETLEGLTHVLAARGRESVPALIDFLGPDRKLLSLMLKSAASMTRPIGDILRDHEQLQILAISALGRLGSDAEPATEAVLRIGKRGYGALALTAAWALPRIKGGNEPPTAKPVALECVEGKSVDVALEVVDSDDMDPALSAEIIEPPRNGVLSRKTDTLFAYSSNPGFSGEDTFKWVGFDGRDKGEPATGTVTVRRDNDAPSVEEIIQDGTATIRLQFNERLARETAEDLANYKLDLGASVAGARLDGDGDAVLLTLSNAVSKTRYSLVVSGVADTSSARNKASRREEFVFVKREPQLLYASGTLRAVAEVFIKAGGSWKHRDDGSNQAAKWRERGFDDSNWKTGPAPLGYGDSGIATVVAFGEKSRKHCTTYFRKAFTTGGISRFSGLALKLRRDDGAVVYLNGTEIQRDNMPGGKITHMTRAGSSVGGADETRFFEYKLPASHLVDGRNVVAVEVHQTSPSSSDVSFDLELLGTLAPQAVK